MTVLSPEEPVMVIRLFGPFEVALRGEAPSRFRSRTEERLLALLTLRHGRDVDRDWLAGLLWPDAETRVALANLRRSLHYLRRTLGRESPRLRTPNPRTLCLDLAGVDADVVAFDTAIARAEIASLQQAVALYRGPLLEDSTDEWLFQERGTREQDYLAALETLAADACERGEPAAAEFYLGRAIAVDPLRETAQRAMMQALADAGNYAGAIHTYRALRDLLHREIRAEPDPATRALFEALRAEARRRAQAQRRRTTDDGPPGTDALLHPETPGTAEPSSVVALVGGPGPSSVVGPEDTLTFLFAGIEDSARLWEAQPDIMRLTVARQDRLLRAAIARHNGHLFHSQGDAYGAAFATAGDALAAALHAQSGLHALHPSAVEAVAAMAQRVRIVLHSGGAEPHAAGYSGPALSRAARLLDVARGAQILLSGATRELVEDNLPPDASLRDLGAHRLRDLQRPERIFQLLHPRLPAEFRPLTSLSTRPNNLPEQLTRFIGREREIAEIRRLLAPAGLQVFGSSGLQATDDVGVPQARGRSPEAATRERRPIPEHLDTRTPEHSNARLVTITGTGGTGKTRLALQLAAELAEAYADGVRFVELGALMDAGLVPQALAATLSLREERGVPLTRALVEHLRTKQILVVLDTCEHLLAACATLAEALLRACPGVVILATSREVLNIPGETSYRLPSLSLPDPGEVSRVTSHESRAGNYRLDPQPSTLDPRPSALLGSEAVLLFLDRAKTAVPSFRLTPENAAAVAQVCRQLDGIPLAIELAAARLTALSIEQIAARLDDRFRLLTGGSRTALPRQQTLRATLDWSYDLLPEPERALLRRLSVFSGGWTLEAAEAVCGDDERPTTNDERRDRGEAADDALPEASVGRRSFVVGRAGLLDLLFSLVDRSLVGVEEREGARRYSLLETTREYARERLEEAGEVEERRARHAPFFLVLAERAEPELRGAAQAEWLQCLEEEHDNLRTAIDYFLTQGAVEAGLRLGGALGPFWWIRGYLSEGRGRLQALLAQSGAGVSCWGLGVGQDTPDSTPKPQHLTPGTQYPPRIRRAQAKALNAAGVLADDQSDYAAARALFEEGLALSRECGDVRGSGLALQNLGGQAARARDYPAARAFYEESMAIWRGLGDWWWTASALTGLGRVAILEEEYATARAHLESGLEMQRELGDRRAMARSLTALGTIAAQLGDDEAAYALIEQSLGLARELGARIAMEEALRALGNLAHERGDHGAALAFQEERLTIAQEVGNTSGAAEALCDLARLAGERGEEKRAGTLWAESLALCQRLGDEPRIAECLEGLASLAVQPDSARWAARIYGAAAALRERVGVPLTGRDRTEYEQQVAAARTVLDEAAFAAAWAEGRAMPVEQAIRVAFEECRILMQGRQGS